MSKRRTKQKGSDSQEYKILEIMANACYKPIINNFSSFPFCLFNWSMDAVDFSAEYEIDHFCFGIIGNICSEFTREDGSKTEQIYLYSLGFISNQSFIPLCEMSSEEKNFPIFKRFFNEVVKSEVYFPEKIHIDYIWNIFSATNFVSNKMTCEKYLNDCFQYLNGENVSLPRCLITSDERVLIAYV